MEEVWKAVVGYEGFYEVSNLGRVRNLGRVDNINHFHKERILKNGARPNGYLCVHLSKNGVAKWHSVHRLVATAFIEKKDGYDIVNHLDNNPKNNRVDNLEWTDYKGNMQHAARQGRMHYQPQNLEKAVNKLKRPVIATDEHGNVYRFDSQAEAVKKLGLNQCARKHIGSACKGKRGYRTVAGFKWRYADE